MYKSRTRVVKCCIFIHAYTSPSEPRQRILFRYGPMRLRNLCVHTHKYTHKHNRTHAHTHTPTPTHTCVKKYSRFYDTLQHTATHCNTPRWHTTFKHIHVRTGALDIRKRALDICKRTLNNHKKQFVHVTLKLAQQISMPDI